ncbi:hypothetical protein [Blautia sp. MSJ-19]|uniref:hypothetical protein n=1 Tax=Blautia sp. MSJ-19 TaxID=2841517 RepID=UPI001C0EDC89|nr:hypothetical protein [Blautia sp. MSJ-19]MBU5481550.1 hypothetical protein [Blautia sp. MSJ-19]
MVTWVVTMLKDYFRDMGFWQGVVSTLIIAICSGIIKYGVDKVKNHHYQKYNCSVDGYWLTVFKSYSGKDTVIELYRIKQKKTRLFLNIQHYSSNSSNPVSVLRGEGAIRESEIACYYTIDNQYSSVVGSLLFQVKRSDSVYNCLSGAYYQMNNMAYEHREFYDKKRMLTKSMVLYKFDRLNIWQKMKLSFGKKVFADYSSAERYVKQEDKDGRFCL